MGGYLGNLDRHLGNKHSMYVLVTALFPKYPPFISQVPLYYFPSTFFFPFGAAVPF